VQEAVVREEDAVQPLRLDQRAPGRDVVQERVGRVDERHVRDANEGFGDLVAAVEGWQ
jgi:hypothetical protein